MAKHKVIEDSDDEDNGSPSPEKAPPPLELNTNPVVNHETSAAPEEPQPSVGSSTASTGMLAFPTPCTAGGLTFIETMNREIRNAHRALIEPTPDNSLTSTRALGSSQQHSPDTPSTSRSKMKRSKTSVERPKAKKPLKRYGSMSRDVFEFRGDSDGEPDGILHNDLTSSGAISKRQTQDMEGKMASTWGLSSGDTEALGSSDRRALDARIENSRVSPQMPPPAMKPTSFEQTQVSEMNPLPATDPMDLTTPANSRTTEDTRSLKLTYSDDRMPTPTMSSRGRSDEGNVLDTDSADGSRKRPRWDMDLEVPDEESGGLVEPSSSASIISPSKTITVTKSTYSVGLSISDETIDDQSPLLQRRLIDGPETINPIVPLPQPFEHDEGQDELSLSISDPEPESKHQKRPTQDPKNKDINEPVHDGLSSDDTTIGLPRDQYQPRPSKSRSGRGNDEVVIPTDHTKKPEATAKKKRKFQRRKTTAFHELIPKDENEEEEDEVIKPPTLSVPKRKTLRILEDSDEEAREPKDNVKENHSRPHGEDEPAPEPQGAKKQRGRPKKGANEPVKDKAAIETKIDHDHEDEEPQKELIVDGFSDKVSQEKRTNPNKPVAAAKEPVSAPKARRGRKRSKVSEAPIAISEEHVHNSDDELGVFDDGQDASRKALDEKEGNSMLQKPAEKTAASPPPPKTVQPPPETPRKATSATPKGPDKHSPISNGKVAYRVGLSKRARIEPLLRIVRKD